MSDWASVLIVFWALFALDGFGWQRLPWFHFSALFGGRRATIRYGGWSFFSAWPLTWRLRTVDLPFSLGAAGITNVPVGAAARPGPLPSTVIAWAWSDIRTVDVRRGWIRLNGQRFARDTGHLTVAELTALAAAATTPVERSALIDRLLHRGLRPLRLRRLRRVMLGRTRLIGWINVTVFVIAAAITLYLSLGGASALNSTQSKRVARLLPWLAAYAGLLHTYAVVLAWRLNRRLKRLGATLPGERFGTALMLPPQALHLRAALADGLFPVASPLAAALAFAGSDERAQVAFNVVTDLSWPLPSPTASHPLAAAITADHRARLRPKIAALLDHENLAITDLLAPPPPDDIRCCAYCPRCQDQFIIAAGRCPHGIPLEKLPR